MFLRLIGSKTFWAGISSVGLGIALVIKGDTTSGIPSIILGVQSIFLRDAIAKQDQ